MSTKKSQVKKYLIDYLKNRIPGFKMVRGKMKCPFHHLHSNQSEELTANIFPEGSNNLYCFAPECGKLGNIIDLYRRIDLEGNEDIPESEIIDMIIDEFKIKINDELDNLFTKYQKWGWDLVPVSKDVGKDSGFGKASWIEEEWQTKIHKSISEWERWVDSGINIGVKTNKSSNCIGLDFDFVKKPLKEKIYGGKFTQEDITEAQKQWDEGFAKIKEKLPFLDWTTVQQKSFGGCYDKETEVLTDHGWKYFKDITKKDKIAQWNNYRIEYVTPLKYFKYFYNGDMYLLNTKTVNLCVTPNHNMYTCASTWNRNNYSFKQMEQIYKNYAPKTVHLIPATFEWGGQEKKWFYLPENIRNYQQTRKPIKKIKMDDWVEFLGWYLSEGGLYINKKTYCNRITIWQSKPKNILKIYRLLKRLPFHFKYFHVLRGDGNINTGFNISNKQLAIYLKQFGLHDKKYIPREILELSSRQLNILYNSLVLGDGDKYGHYYTSSVELANNVQEIILKLGSKASIIERKKRKPHHKAAYIIAKHHHKKNSFRQKDIKKISYSDFVYCVEVPSHLIIVRRHGKMLVCGNSHLFYLYDEEIPKTWFDYEGIHIDIEADGGQIVVEPSIVGGQNRQIIGKEIKSLPKEAKDFILANCQKVTVTDKKEIKPEEIENYELTFENLNSNRNNTFCKLYGMMRQDSPIDVATRHLKYFNNLMDKKLPLKEILAMAKQAEKYHKIDCKAIADRILEYFGIVKDTLHFRDLKDYLRLERKDIEEALRYLQDERKIIKIKKDVYQLLADVEWKTDFVTLSKPLDMFVPYVGDYAVFNRGSMLVLSGKTGSGKTTWTVNFIEQFIKQGIRVKLITTEADSGIGEIALARGLKEGDFLYYQTSDPLTVPFQKDEVRIIDWITPTDNDYTKIGLIYKQLNDKLVDHGGLLIALSQLKDNGEFFAPNQISQYASLAGKFLYPEKNGQVDHLHPYLEICKMRRPKTNQKFIQIPMEYNFETKELRIKK